jgi:hypothetical protein
MSETPSRQTLDLVPARCITFVIAIAKYPAIAAALDAKGYDQAETDFVWTRLARLGQLPSKGPGPGVAEANVLAAVRELDAWDEKNFEAITRILDRTFPAFVSILFHDLEPKEGPEAVDSVSTLLDRLDALETSTEPDAGAVLKLLAKRGYPPAERQRLRALVLASSQFAPKATLSDAERLQILTELYGWISDWSATARLVITRRQHLIALGIASPRKHDNTPPEEGSGGGDGAKGTGGTAAKVAPAEGKPPAAPAKAPDGGATPPAAPATSPDGAKTPANGGK